MGMYSKREQGMFSRNLDHAELLKPFQNKDRGKITTASRLIPFAEDLIDLHIKKVQC